LSDRDKREPVDWNMLGARVGKQFRAGGAAFDARVDVRSVIQHSLVDYDWEIDGGLRTLYPLTSRLALMGTGGLRRLGVDGSRGRDDQTGARIEGGVRLTGRGAAVELFVAAERRIDPYPLEAGVERWVSAGFRVTSR
jgi:hypothetical protein